MATLADVLADLSIALGDGVQGAATGGSNGTLIDTARWQLGRDNEHAGKEILFLAPPAGWPGVVYVTASTATSATLTFTPALPAGQVVAAGTPYLLGGRRFSAGRKLQALRQCLDEAAPSGPLIDTSLVVGATPQELEIPAAFVQLGPVDYRPVGAAAGQWFPLGRPYCRVIRGARTLRLDPPCDLRGATLRLHGIGPVRLPTLLTDAVPVPTAWLVPAAKAALTRDLVLYQQHLKRAPSPSGIRAGYVPV